MRTWLTFDTADIFTPELRPLVDRFLLGEMSAEECGRHMGLPAVRWHALVGAIFTEGLKHTTRVKLEVEDATGFATIPTPHDMHDAECIQSWEHGRHDVRACRCPSA